jgi:glycine cleavage system transcriptional repressor
MSLVVLSVVGSDRPGIAAGVTRVLYEAGCNLEDATSTILRGHFAMVLIVETAAEVDAASLEDRLAPVADELGLTVTARPVEAAPTDVTAPTHMVSVYGADRPGIVYRVTDALARAGANVTDLESRLIGPPESPVYALMLEVAIPAGSGVLDDLAALKDEADLDMSVHPIDADVL